MDSARRSNNPVAFEIHAVEPVLRSSILIESSMDHYMWTLLTMFDALVAVIRHEQELLCFHREFGEGGSNFGSRIRSLVTLFPSRLLGCRTDENVRPRSWEMIGRRR